MTEQEYRRKLGGMQRLWEAEHAAANTLRDVVLQVGAERNELARQLDDARRLACHYHELLHQTHERPYIIERDGKTR